MKDIRICFVGDSFVNGTGDPEKLGWSGRLCAHAENASQTITYYNLGIRRNTSTDIAQRWETECRARLPETSENKIVFSFGVNDVIIENGQQRVSTQKSLENTRNILTQAQQDYDVIMVGPPPINDAEINIRINNLDKQFNIICKKLNIPYLSIFDTLINNNLWMREVANNDGAHPKNQGYEYLANFIQHQDIWWFYE